MSDIHEQITKEEIENSELDKKILSLLTRQCNDYVVNKDDVQQVVNGKQTVNVAVSKVVHHFNTFFSPVEELCHLVMQEYHSILPEQKQVVQSLKFEKKKLEDEGKDTEKKGERFIGSKNTEIGIKAAKAASWFLYVFGFISTVFFLVEIAEMAWWKAVFLPLIGVNVIYWGVKGLFFSLSHAKTPIYPVVKYALGVIGIGCAAAWLYYFAKLASSLAGPVDIGSLNDPTNSSSAGHESEIMIYLGALGEALVGAFLSAVGNDLKEKHIIFDAIQDTQEYAILKDKIEKAEKAADVSNDRINHAQNLLAIVDGKREHVKSETASIYNELFHASIN